MSNFAGDWYTNRAARSQESVIFENSMPVDHVRKDQMRQNIQRHRNTKFFTRKALQIDTVLMNLDMKRIDSTRVLSLVSIEDGSRFPFFYQHQCAAFVSVRHSKNNKIAVQILPNEITI